MNILRYYAIRTFRLQVYASTLRGCTLYLAKLAILMCSVLELLNRDREDCSVTSGHRMRRAAPRRAAPRRASRQTSRPPLYVEVPFALESLRQTSGKYQVEFLRDQC